MEHSVSNESLPSTRRGWAWFARFFVVVVFAGFASLVVFLVQVGSASGGSRQDLLPLLPLMFAVPLFLRAAKRIFRDDDVAARAGSLAARTMGITALASVVVTMFWMYWRGGVDAGEAATAATIVSGILCFVGGFFAIVAASKPSPSARD